MKGDDMARMKGKFSIAWQEKQLRVKSPMLNACKALEARAVRSKARTEDNVDRLLKEIYKAESDQKRQELYIKLNAKK